MMNRNLSGRGLLLLWLACVPISCADEDGGQVGLELLMAEASEIGRMEDAGGKQQRYTSALSWNNGSIVDLDYHLSRGLIFWIAGSHVFSADLDDAGNSTRAIIKQPADTWQPLGLAVDFVGERLYVADALGCKVDAFSLKGKNHVIVAAEGLDRPSGIVLDPQATLGFVADSDKIIRMNLDGGSAYPIVRKSVPSSISSLAIDTTSKRLLWWDGEIGAIESASYIGAARHVVHRSKGAAVAGIALADGRLYFADGRALYRKDEQQERARLVREGALVGLRAVREGARAAGPAEACGPANGGCQHACLASEGAPAGRSCACYVGHLLAEDARSCGPAGELLLYSHRQLLRGRGLEPGARLALSLAGPGGLALSLAADPEDNAVYLADANRNAIYRTDLRTGRAESVASYAGSASLGLDGPSRNLYYSDWAEGTLNVLSLRNQSQRRRLLDSLSAPGEVLVHPARGQVYLYDEAKIKRVNADGSNLVTIHAPRPHASLRLALDAADDRLYWCLNDLELAGRNASIWHAAHDGSDLVGLPTVRQLRDVSAMIVHGQWIYAVAAGYEQLLRLRKADGRQLARVAPAERRGFYALAVMRLRPDETQPVSPCAAGACDKLCFAVPRTKARPGLARRCACPTGERLVARRQAKPICKPEHALKELKLVHRCEPDWEFGCRNGRCIPKTQLCDGVNDCLDRSDERGCAGAERNYFVPAAG